MRDSTGPGGPRKRTNKLSASSRFTSVQKDAVRRHQHQHQHQQQTLRHEKLTATTRGSSLRLILIPGGVMALPLLVMLPVALLVCMPFGTRGQGNGGAPVAAANDSQAAQDAAFLNRNSNNSSDPSGMDGLVELGASYTPLSEDGGRLNSILHGGRNTTTTVKSGGLAAQTPASSKPAGAGGGGGGGGGRSSGSGSGSGSGSSSACMPHKDVVLDYIDRTLRSSQLWTVQNGVVDFGFLGDEVPKDCEPNCAFSNPNAPYGLTLLPLAPTEAQTKAFARSTPRGVANELRGSSMAAPSLANSSASAVPGSAPIYQLMPQEVVLVAGCTPPAAGSVYFSATPYIHTVWSDSAMKWVSVFGSMGDSASTHRPELQPLQPSANLSAHIPSARGPPPSRLATFNPQPALGQLMLQAAAGRQGLGSGRLGRWGRWTGPFASAMSQSAAAAAIGGGVAGSGSTAAATAAAAPTSIDASTASSGAGFDQFFVAAMTASPAAATALARVLQPVLDNLAGSLPGRARINLLPIPGPEFSEDIGLDPRSPYYMMMLRSIVPAGALASGFRPYAQARPIRSWRLTPVVEAESLPAGPLLDSADAAGAATAAGGAGGGLLATLRRGGRAGGGADDGEQRAAGAVLTGPDPPLTVIAKDRFALPNVIPRRPAAASTQQQLRQRREDAVFAMTGPDAAAAGPAGALPGRNVTSAAAFRASGSVSRTAAESWLAPAFEYLQRKVQETFEKRYAMAWSLTTGSWLGALDPPVDWGLQCLEQMIDYCNGDNRDVTYVSSFPYVTLNRLNALALVVGVHHVRTGLASYISIALSDPTQRLGLQAFDGSQLQGTADSYLQNTPYEEYSPYLFVAMFARNCSGMGLCNEIPTDGPRSTPLGRNMVATLRAYTNPVTGVGPDPDDLLKFVTANLVQRADARPQDYRPRQLDPNYFGRDGCTSALLGQVLCAQGPDEACCRQVQKWSDTGCWCLDTGKALLNALGPMQGRAMLTATSRLCRATRPAISIAEC